MADETRYIRRCRFQMGGRRLRKLPDKYGAEIAHGGHNAKAPAEKRIGFSGPLVGETTGYGAANTQYRPEKSQRGECPVALKHDIVL